MSSSVKTDLSVSFVCCTKTVERIKNYGQSGLFGDPNTRPFYIDTQGFLVCPEHGGRRFGWQSVRKTEYPSIPQNLDRPPQTILLNNYTESTLERDQSIRRELGL